MYSKAKEKRLAKLVKWPDLRYSPTGESKLFYEEKDVPEDWTAKAPRNILICPTPSLNKVQLEHELTERGIKIKPTWGNAHMKRILDGDVSSAW